MSTSNAALKPILFADENDALCGFANWNFEVSDEGFTALFNYFMDLMKWHGGKYYPGFRKISLAQRSEFAMSLARRFKRELEQAITNDVDEGCQIEMPVYALLEQAPDLLTEFEAGYFAEREGAEASRFMRWFGLEAESTAL